MTFSAVQSPITGKWWVRCEWPRSKYRYGGSSLIWPAPNQATAEAVAADMEAKKAQTGVSPVA